MTRDLDSCRDDLDIRWRTIDRGRNLSLTRLKTRLHRQTPLIGAAAIGCILIGIAGLVLGAFTLWQGWSLDAPHFATRGAGILAVASLALLAAPKLRRMKAGNDGKGMRGLVDLELARALGAIGAVRLGLAACAVAMLAGLAGTAIRYASGNPPALSPLADLALLSGGALALLLAGFRAHARLLKFAHLRRLLRRG